LVNLKVLGKTFASTIFSQDLDSINIDYSQLFIQSAICKI
jgi:hypothetical protein